MKLKNILLPFAGIQLRTVYSHQQAIAQSETFLKQFRLPATAMANTAMAAKFVAESKDPTKAAIASAETAALYGLEILVPNINTDSAQHHPPERQVICKSQLSV